MARIVSLGPVDAGKAWRLEAECLLGRRLDCQVCVHDQRASRRHARVRREPDGLYLEDLGSSNGTYLNGQRVEAPARLRHGDELELGVGGARFRADLSDEAPAGEGRGSVTVTAGAEAQTAMIEVANLAKVLEKRRGSTGDLEAEREIERLQRKLQAMYRLADTAAGAQDPTGLLERVVALVLEVFPQASTAAAVLVDPRTHEFRTPCARRRRGAAAGVSIPQAVVDRVLRQGHSVLLRAPGEGGPTDTMVIKNPLVRVLGDGVDPPEGGAVGWRMGAPLSFRSDHLGILHVEAEAALGYFTQDDLDLLGGLATQASLALHLIQLHQGLLARERMDHDLRLARQIQRNLLPREPPRIPGLDFAVHYEPAFQVGGDFYDFLWVDPQRLALGVGDVSGKAISGALFMARVTSEVRAVAPLDGAPRRVLGRVNRVLAEVSEDGMFVTMVYISLDLETQTLRYANAGHTTPLIRRGGRVLSLEAPEARAMPLAVTPRLEVGEATVALEPGDVLLLYTDGIIEARSRAGEFYGQARLEAVLGRTVAGARGTLEAVLADLDRFVEDAPQADDQTVVCLHVTGSAVGRSSLVPEE